MSSLDRKIKRKKSKEFAKTFKKTVKNFENYVRCISCGRVPNVIMGEKIDQWHIKSESGLIELTCPECREVADVD
tara:strand:- start:202 stop:426 length:225 start_codon:yes stop_codon:yes gene_type:complete